MSTTVQALKLFEGFRGKEDLVRVYVEAASNFSPEELKDYSETFVKYDVNKSGDLDVFELNRMYESRGETKTNSELQELIRSIGDEFGATMKKDGVTFHAYLSVLLKDKKGLNKTAWGSFAVIAKKHDSSKATGKIANVFEQKAAEANSEEARIKADQELRKASRQMKKEEEESKKKKQAALAKFQANLNNKSGAQ